MTRQITVIEVHATLADHHIDATFDERLQDDDAPDPHRRIVLDKPEYPYGAALDLWRSGGGEVPDYVEPEPIPFVPHLNGGGLVRFSGASPTTVYEAFSMLSVTRVAKGRYRAYHEAPMPSDQYSANPSVLDINPRIARVTARTPLYVEVRVTDLAGVAQDPAEITIETMRVIYS